MPCRSYEYRNCTGNEYTFDCNLDGEYYPRQWKKTLDDAKVFCESNPYCSGITRGNGGYEPRKGPNVGQHVAAHELWLCIGTPIYMYNISCI